MLCNISIFISETSVCTAPPSTVDNGVVTTSRQVNGFMWLGENVTVACDTGYYISRGDDFDEFSGNFGDDDGGDDDDDDSAYSMYRRSKSVKCGEDGLWSSALPSCEGKLEHRILAKARIYSQALTSQLGRSSLCSLIALCIYRI